LQFALVALAGMVVFTVLWNIGLGVDEPTLGSVVAHYFAWGRWAEVATVLLLAALVVVAPLLPGARRAAHVIVSGGVIAIVGDLIDLSRFPSPNVVDLVRDNAIPVDLVAGRAFQFSIQATPTYVWAAGVLLVGVGMFILSVDTEDRAWSRVSLTLGIALSLVALTDINVETAWVSWIASWVAMGVLFNWLLVTLRVIGQPDGLPTRAISSVKSNRNS
jgi:hypothetical protein